MQASLTTNRWLTGEQEKEMKRNAPKCILGAVVVALFLTITWSTTSARLSTIPNNTAVEAGAASSNPASPKAGRAIVIDSAPNASLEAIADPVSASVVSPFAKAAGNLDQARNGSAASPTTPVDWVNGNAGASNSHYREGYSIPYRLILTGLAAGPHNVVIEWDIRNNGKNAIDYITYYDRLNSPSHQAVFGHAAEVIDPTLGFVGLGAATGTAIPAPSSAGSTVAGQPATSFGLLPAGERNMTSYNTTGVVTLTYLSEGSLAAASSSTSLNINFTGSGTVVFAWGGHIGSQTDWGAGNSASAVSGSPYHTRLLSLDGSGGNQDRSLSAGAVVVDCATCSVGANATAECGTQKVHTSTIGAGGVCDNPAHSWSFVSNTSGAAFVGGTTGSSVTVNVGNACSGSYTVRDTITCSGCTTGATIFCDQTVSVSDTTPPSISCPANITVQCDSDIPASNTGSVTALDNCSVPTRSFVGDISSGSCPKTITRTYRATDACGNSTTCTQVITVNDTTPPSITCPANITVQCDADVPASNTASVTASDNCGTPTKSFVGDSPSGTCPKVITRTYRATDGCNNSTTCTQTITVNDTTPPSITCPASVTVQCDADVPAADTSSVTASDNCAGTPTKSFEGDSPSGTCPKVITRTYKATDVCGNSATCTQTITVSDTTPPSLSCPPDAVVTCKTDVPAAATTVEELVTQGGSASDNCSAVGITFEDGEPSDISSCGENCGGKLVRTYTATDDCGNTSTCTQTITWGTPASAQSAQQVVIASLLKSGDVVVGVPGTNSLTIPGGLNANSSALCIVSKLSASGTAGSLAAGFGDQRLNPSTCQTSPSLELQKDGTWNVVLSQTISLALNLRMNTLQLQLKQNAQTSGLSVPRANRPDADFDLSSFTLTSSFLTQGALPGPDGLMGTSDDELDLSSARTQFVIPASILSALGSRATAADLLRLANTALAGVPTGDVRLSDIAAALDAVNRSFDFGKRRIILNSQPSQR